MSPTDCIWFIWLRHTPVWAIHQHQPPEGKDRIFCWCWMLNSSKVPCGYKPTVSWAATGKALCWDWDYLFSSGNAEVNKLSFSQPSCLVSLYVSCHFLFCRARPGHFLPYELLSLLSCCISWLRNWYLKKRSKHQQSSVVHVLSVLHCLLHLNEPFVPR